MKQYLDGSVRVYRLNELQPDMKQSYPLGHIESERGTLTPLMLDKSYQYLALIGFKSGIARGGHYHVLKKEIFFVVRGDIRLSVASKSAFDKKETITLSGGDLVEIDAGVWHLYEPLSDAEALDFSPDKYVDGDTYPL